MEKIALLSDIHGNLQALNAVLEDAQQEGVERLLIAGDLISDCPDSCAVLDIVQKGEEEGRFLVIKGNREIYYERFLKGDFAGKEDLKQVSALIWTFNQLQSRHRDYLSSLKSQRTLSVGELSLLMVHGSPASPFELLYRDKIKTIDKYLLNMDEDILLCGHTHCQWHRRSGAKTLINPGALGVHFNDEKRAEYTILEVEGRRLTIREKRVPYDLLKLENRFHESGLLQKAPLWSRAIIKSLHRGDNISLALVHRGEEIMVREKIETAHGLMPDELWDRLGREFNLL